MINSFFNKSKKSEEQQEEQYDVVKEKDNPYLSARKEYEDRYGSVVQAAARWRQISILLCIVTMFFAATLVWLAAQNKVVPYIVQIDNQGFTVAIRPAEAASAPDQRIVIATLGRFITDLRTIVTDPAAQRRLVDSVYAHISSGTPAEATIGAFFNENNPFETQGGRMARNVQVRTVMPHEAGTQRGRSWLVLWTEHVTNNGIVVESSNWRAIIQIGVTPIRELEAVLRNPLGIFVVELDMAREII